MNRLFYLLLLVIIFCSCSLIENEQDCDCADIIGEKWFIDLDSRETIISEICYYFEDILFEKDGTLSVFRNYQEPNGNLIEDLYLNDLGTWEIKSNVNSSCILTITNFNVEEYLYDDLEEECELNFLSGFSAISPVYFDEISFDLEVTKVTCNSVSINHLEFINML